MWPLTPGRPLQRFGASVSRRYNDFVVFHDLLLQKFPYRMVPALPPKKMLGGTRPPQPGPLSPRPPSRVPLLPSSVPVSLRASRPPAIRSQLCRGARGGAGVVMSPGTLGPMSLLLGGGRVRTSSFPPVAPGWGPGAPSRGGSRDTWGPDQRALHGLGRSVKGGSHGRAWGPRGCVAPAAPPRALCGGGGMPRLPGDRAALS